MKQKIEQVLPAQLSANLAGKARSFGGDVRAAIADGRQAMQEREGRLRAQLDARYQALDR